MDLSHLAGLSEEEFERERCRLIDEYIQSLPEDRRLKAHLVQFRIDTARDSMSRDEFMRHLTHELTESMENMVDQFVLIRNTLR